MFIIDFVVHFRVLLYLSFLIHFCEKNTIVAKILQQIRNNYIVYILIKTIIIKIIKRFFYVYLKSFL